jgi:predicted transcriptional regulator/archaellum biogenesis ATPase FlaH
MPAAISIIKKMITTDMIAISTKINICGLKRLPPKEYILKRLEITKGCLALLCASGSSGKTMLVQYLACCVSSGINFLDRFGVSKGNVGHVDAEQSAIQTQRRYERLAAGLGLIELDVDRIDLGSNRIDDPKFALIIEDKLTELFKGKSLIIIDSLKAISLADENKGDIEQPLKILKRVAEKNNCSIILIHHKGKGNSDAKQSARGHSSIYDSVDIQIDLDHDIHSNEYELKCKKNRDGAIFDGLRYSLEDSGDFNKDQNCSEQLILTLMSDQIKASKGVVKQHIISHVKSNEGINLTSLYDLCKGEKALFNESLDECVKDGFILEKIGSRKSRLFSITEAGSSFLEWDM